MYWEYKVYDNITRQKVSSINSLHLRNDVYYESICIPEENLTLKTFGISSRPADWPIINRCSKSHFLHFVLAGKGWCNGIPFEVGDVIYCPQNKIFNLSAHQDNPCNLTWVSFSGGKSEHYLKLLGLGYSHQCYKAQHMQEIIQIFYEMLEYEHCDNLLPLYFESCLTRILSLAVPASSASNPNDDNPFQSHRINTATRFIASHFRDPDLRIADIANATQTSEKHLQRMFKKELGISIHQYIAKSRMAAAETLLHLSNYNINEIAEFTGYSDRRSFYVAFKKHFGMSPSEYGTSIEKKATENV